MVDVIPESEEKAEFSESSSHVGVQSYEANYDQISDEFKSVLSKYNLSNDSHKSQTSVLWSVESLPQARDLQDIATLEELAYLLEPEEESSEEKVSYKKDKQATTETEDHKI